MTDIAIWQPGEVASPAELPNSQLDDWIMVADKVVRLAEVVCRSPFVPDGLRGSVPATAAAILTGRELGIPPMTSLANIHVIHGKPGLSALVMRALVLSKGHEWQDVDVTNTRVVVKGRRKGESEWTAASFSVQDAQTAKLQLGGYPQDKLYARASARLARRKFADVIAGMPYSIEELEDGITDEDSPAAEAAAAAPAAAPDGQPKPRTAQRRKARTDVPPAQAATPHLRAAEPSVPHPEGAGGTLPPLPGEDEPDPTAAPAQDTGSPPSASAPDDTDYDTPGTVSDAQLKAIWTILGQAFHFDATEKDQARKVCAYIVRHDLASSKNLTFSEAKAVLDTLGHWQHQAQQAGEDPRAWMLTVMAAPEGEVPSE